MKKIFILIFAIFLCLNTRADQLSCLTKANADKASDIIKSKEFLVLFCGCCDNNELEMVKHMNKSIETCIKESGGELNPIYDLVNVPFLSIPNLL